MVKFVFLAAMLVNIIFFFWEYRLGAPEIYLPPATKSATLNAQKIILLSQPPKLQEEAIKTADQDQQPEEQMHIKNESFSADDSISIHVNEFVGPIEIPLTPEVFQTERLTEITINPEPVQNKTDVAPKSTVIIETPVIACFQLYNNDDKQKILAQSSQQNDYSLSFTEQEQTYIKSYLVLTLPAESLAQAIELEKMLRQQGINDLWLFRQGVFKWHISLGLFSSANKAELAKQQYVRNITQPLIVRPSIQTKTVTLITITTRQDEILASFKQNFAQHIDKEVDCLPPPNKVNDRNLQ